MFWDRFDICDAWYRFAMDYHEGQWSKTYAIFGRLIHMQYKPGAQVTEDPVHEWDSENARVIYYNLAHTALGRS